MSTMYDSTNPAAIPAGVLALGYLDGASSAWPAGAAARFAQVVWITVTGRTGAGIRGCDVERFDLTPAQGASWVQAQHDSGVLAPQLPFVYCSLDQVAEVTAACSALGLVRGRDWELGVAHYDGIPLLDDPSWAFKQYANSALTGQDYDLSITRADWPGGDMIDQQTIDAIWAWITENGDPLLRDLQQRAAALQTQLDSLPTTAGGGLTADQAAQLAQLPALAASLQRIEAALKGA